jgi:hypothetical protein
MNLGSMDKDDSYITGSRFFLGCGIALVIATLLGVIAFALIVYQYGQYTAL